MDLDSIKDTIRQKIINFIPPLKRQQDQKALRYQKFADLASQASAAGRPVPDVDNPEAVRQFLGEPPPPKLGAIDQFLLNIMPQKIRSPIVEGPPAVNAEPPALSPKLNEIDRSVRLPTATVTPTRPSPTVAVPTVTPPPDRGADPYYKLINASAAENGIPQDILYRLLRTESIRFNPDVISGKINSPVGAQGMAQFMPGTSKGMGFDPLDPKQAIPAAARYLKANYDRFGSWEEALAAYNAGPGNVNKYQGEPYNGIPPFPETLNYIQRILNNE